MQLNLTQDWEDDRLYYRGIRELIAVDMSVLDKIWKPDTHFFNGIESYIHHVPRPNKFVLLVFPYGYVLYSLR